MNKISIVRLYIYNNIGIVFFMVLHIFDTSIAVKNLINKVLCIFWDQKMTSHSTIWAITEVAMWTLLIRAVMSRGV